MSKTAIVPVEEWKMSKEVEEYLNAYDRVKRLATRISDIAEQMTVLADALSKKPEEAIASLDTNYPTYDQLKELLSEFIGEKTTLPLLWKRIEPRTQQSMASSGPETATRIGMWVQD